MPPYPIKPRSVGIYAKGYEKRIKPKLITILTDVVDDFSLSSWRRALRREGYTYDDLPTLRGGLVHPLTAFSIPEFHTEFAGGFYGYHYLAFWTGPHSSLQMITYLSDFHRIVAREIAMRIFYRKCINVARRRVFQTKVVDLIIRAVTDGNLRLWCQAIHYYNMF